MGDAKVFRSRINWTWVVVVALVILAAPADLFAWGPATHVGIGRSILDQLGLLPAGIAAIIGRHGWSYLYGCIAADVVFAKRWSRVKQFCHHWSTGFNFLDAAKSDTGKSFAYGYLSHLAADTVAHGKYVPRQIVVSGSSVNFGHLYWELRADAAIDSHTRCALADTLAQDHNEHQVALRGHLSGTLLSFPLNRVLFGRMNALALNESFGQTVNFCGRHSRWPLPAELLSAYHAESVDRTLSVLTEGRKSALLREDPNGTSALLQARINRKDMRRLRGHGISVHRRVNEMALALLPAPVRQTEAKPKIEPEPVLAEA